MTKQKLKQNIAIIIILSIFLFGLFCLCKKATDKLEVFYTKFFVMHTDNWNVIVPKIKEKKYNYNDQIPVEVVKKEIIKQAKKYKNDEKFMIELADCESDFNNLADNKISTAKGVYQFLAGTWEETESNQNKISPFDYIANIEEANIKIANKEYWRWEECLK